MRIGIDVSKVGDQDGIGRYSHHLVKALLELDTVNEYKLFSLFRHPSTDDPSTVLGKLPAHCEFMSHKHPQWNDVDLFHSTAYKVPSGYRNRLVYTVHDLTFITHPEFHTLQNRIHCLKGTVTAACRADKMIAVSDHTKKDITEHLAVPQEMTEVIPLGADKRFKPSRDNKTGKSLSDKYGIRSPYIFSLGSIEPRKNLNGIIRAFALLPKDLLDTHLLVIAGGEGWLNSDIYRYVQESDLCGQIKILGCVVDEDLPMLYSSAELFAYPSFYEGFGLPVLEAMACGVPVITSRISSLPEVAGDAAILVDPYDVTSIRNGMVEILTHAGKRKELVEAGINRSGMFSWLTTAEKTIALYERVMGSETRNKRMS